MKKNRILIALLLVLALTVCLVPAALAADTDGEESAPAEEIVEEAEPEEALPEEEETLPEEEEPITNEGEELFNNGAVVYNNGGTVYNNGGTVYNNAGVTYNNAGVVYNNGGTVYNNNGTVYNNGGTVFNNGPAPETEEPVEESAEEPAEEPAGTEEPAAEPTKTEKPAAEPEAPAEEAEKSAAAASAAEGAELELPVIDLPTGTYAFDEERTVTITAPEGAKVYYTTDGTDPTEESALYEEPIPLTEGMILRCAIVDENGEVGEVVSAVYAVVRVTVPEIPGQKKNYSKLSYTGITFENPGTVDAVIVHVRSSSSKFMMNHTTEGVVPAGETDDVTWGIKPITGLKSGTYETVVTVEFDSGETLELPVSFTVE